MGDIVVGQELLLGYLMNVLDVDEVAEVEKELARQPKLRSELAKLQKQISPLDILLESMDPPSDLARRTCDNIWATVQDKNFADDQHILQIAETQNQTQKSIIQFNPLLTVTATNLELPNIEHATNYFCDVESDDIDAQDNNLDDQEIVLANSNVNPDSDSHSENLVVVNTANNNRNDNVVATARRNRRRLKQDKTKKQKNTQKNILLQQFAISAVIGIMIAIIIYPAVNYFIGRVTQVVVRQKVQQLDNNIEVYTQLSSSHAQTLPDEINLTQYGWQELILSPEHIFANNNNQLLNVTKNPNNEKSSHSVSNLVHINSISQLLPQHETMNIINSDLRNYLFLGQSNQSSVSLLPNETKNTINNNTLNFLNEHNTTSNLPQSILVLEGSQIRPAVGQNILIQNGRVFFRILPHSSSHKVDAKK
jgi:hypothetical protein